MPSVLQNRHKVWILIIFNLIFDELVSLPLIGLDVQGIVTPLTSAIGLKGGKLGLLEMLTLGQVLLTPDGMTILQLATIPTNYWIELGGTVTEGDIVHYYGPTKAMTDGGDLWPDSVIPYMFHQSVDDEHKNLVKEAMSHWEEHTCLRFRRKNKKDGHYIRFRTDTSGCWSAVGRRFDRPGAQDVSLGLGCFKFYTAIHEIGHTIGYFHEHSRTDRDKFVQILWNNVKPGMNIQFQHKNTRNEIFEYDYRSIMHYPAWAFSKTPLKENVVLSKNPFSQYQIDEEKNTISFRDIKLTNLLYKCNEKCPNLEQTKCLNGGVLKPDKLKGKLCNCLCPPGFGGEFCQKLENINQIDPTLPKCGGNITEQGTISTPNYPARKETFESCSYWIKAPLEHRVRVTFEDFSFAQPYVGSVVSQKSIADGLCLYESVDIRKSDDIYEGSIYCGEQIRPNTVMESEANHFIIIIIADDQKIGRGLKARVDFIQDKNRSERKTNRHSMTLEPNKEEPIINVLGLINL